jgi:hypothetical protein
MMPSRCDEIYIKIDPLEVECHNSTVQQIDTG